MKLVADCMTKIPHSIEPNCSVKEAKKRMYDMAVTHMPVLSGGKIIGILSERDILYLKGLETVDLGAVKVGDAMTNEPVIVPSDRPLSEVCTLMVKERIGSILVSGDDGKLAGIFTYTDALKTLAELNN